MPPTARIAALLGVLTFPLAPAPAAPPSPGASNLCDLAAASSLDTTRPPGIPGTAPGDVDPTVAIPACEAALAADPANPRLKFQLARAAFRAGDEQRSLRLNIEAAEAGHTIAANNSGVQFNKGQGTPKDHARAEFWFRRAADGGASVAMRNLGDMIFATARTPAEQAEAAYWFRRSAEAGYSGGMVWYGYMLEYGTGVRRDLPAAATWYRRGGEAGNSDGWVGLAVLMQNGKGVKRDPAEADVLLRRAAEAGNADAKKRLDNLERRPRQ